MVDHLSPDHEQQGLLAPERLPSGYRIYSESDVETVCRIRCLE
ncbi:MAG TPA: MerR family transcriptional regulator [Actinomadura sp.]|nr:MerR family transcriptional regulator [Actinomadura sp.]